MAKSRTNGEVKEQGVNGAVSELPEGFERVNALDGVQNWASFEAGRAFEGELLGRFTMNKPGKDGKIRAYYQLRLTKPAMVTRGSGDDKETIEAEPGEVVNLDEKSALASIRPLVDSGKRYVLHVKAIEKKSIGGGQSFWRCAVGKREITAE